MHRLLLRRESIREIVFIALFVAMATLLHGFTAYGLDLDSARNKGLVGEVDSGYIAIPPGAPRDAAGLVETVNTERRSAYEAIAGKNNVTVAVAGKLTFEKRYPDFPAGTWVNIQGTWMKKQ